MLKKIVSIFVLMITAGPALAWDASVEGPDVFGVTKVFASDAAGRESLVVQCDSKDVLFVAFIMRKKEFEETPVAAAKLLIQVDGASPVTLEALRRDWNDNYFGVVAEGRTAELVSMVKAIQGGKGKINAGVDVEGVQYSATFSTRGSTSAMTKVINGCGLASIPPA